MSPLFQKTLEAKAERRKQLMALPFPEKVRIVEKLRDATREIHRASGKGRANDTDTGDISSDLSC